MKTFEVPDGGFYGYSMRSKQANEWKSGGIVSEIPTSHMIILDTIDSTERKSARAATTKYCFLMELGGRGREFSRRRGTENVSELIVFARVVALAKERKRGVVTTPKVKMVKRKTDSYELLPDHRLL